MTLFETAHRDLRKLGIELEKLPGEFRVSYRQGSPSPATFEWLEEAIEAGHRMAAERPYVEPTRGPRLKGIPDWCLRPKALRKRRYGRTNARFRRWAAKKGTI